MSVVAGLYPRRSVFDIICVAMAWQVSSVNDEELKEYLRKSFELDRTLILPEAELLNHLRLNGFDFSRAKCGDGVEDATESKEDDDDSAARDIYNLASWYVSELEFVISSVFGDARHPWGFTLRAIDNENE